MSLYRRSLFLAASAALLGLAPAEAANLNQTLQGRELRLENLVANVEIRLDPAAQGVNVAVTGNDEYTALVSMTTEGDVAVVRMRDLGRSWNIDDNNTGLRMTITMAPGQALAVAHGFVGTLTAGDLNAPVSIDASSGNLTIGKVTNASVEIDGSADLILGDINGRLSLQTSGSGYLKAGSALDTSISISGSGDAEIASVRGALGIEINGSADVEVGSIDGPTAIDISGSGSVKIRGGRANPLQLSSSGSGEVDFNGTAVNPQIDASGSGDVCIAKVEGSIQLDGAHVTIDPNACGRS